MKNIILLLILCLTSPLLFSVNEKEVNQIEIIKKENQRINIELLNLKKEFSNSINQIQKNEIFFSKLNLIFVVITVVIALLGVGLPLITFLLGKREVENLRLTVQDYIKHSEYENIKKNIEKLSSKDGVEKYEAAVSLNMSDTSYINPKDVEKIIDLYEKEINVSSYKSLLLSILSKVISPETINFFKKVIEKDLQNNIHLIIYFMVKSKFDFTNDLIVRLSNQKDSIKILYSMIIMNHISDDFTLELLENKKVVNIILEDKSENLNLEEIKNILNYLDTKITNKEKIKKTYFYQKANNLVEEFTKQLKEEELKKQQENNSENTITENERIITNLGLVNVNGVIKDKDSKEYIKTKAIPTILGLQELKECIKVDDTLININSIPKQKPKNLLH